jgi:hypothetical protein
VSLARAAEYRRGASIELEEATDTVAKAIRDQLRSGDEVVLESAMFDEVLGYAPDHAPLYRALRVRRVVSVPTVWKDVLARDFALIGLGADAAPGGEYKAAGDVGDFHPATPTEREEFAREAEAVVKAFTKLVRTEAKSHQESAKKAVKHTPR